MAKDNFNDYEELLSMFEDKKEIDTVKPADEETLKTKRQKKVDDFKININSNSSYENPNYKGGVYFSNPPRDIDKAAQREKKATVRRNQRTKSSVDKFKVSAPPTTEKQNKVALGVRVCCPLFCDRHRICCYTRSGYLYPDIRQFGLQHCLA